MISLLETILKLQPGGYALLLWYRAGLLAVFMYRRNEWLTSRKGDEHVGFVLL
jgi:hypothetical protein